MIAHVAQFLFITLIASLVYHALRVEDVKAAAIAGLKRFGSCLLLTAIGAVILQLFTRWV